MPIQQMFLGLGGGSGATVYAIDLDGNDSIEYPGPGDGISGDFTMECFFYMDSGASGFQRIFSTKEELVFRRANDD